MLLWEGGYEALIFTVNELIWALGGLMGLGPVAKTVMVIILVYLLLIRR